MDPPGNRAREQPKRRFMDTVKEDMRETGLREEEATDRNAEG